MLYEELRDKMNIIKDKNIKTNKYYSDDLTYFVYSGDINLSQSTYINNYCNEYILFGGKLFDDDEFDIKLKIEDCKVVEGTLYNNKLLFKYSIYINKDLKGKIHMIEN